MTTSNTKQEVLAEVIALAAETRDYYKFISDLEAPDLSDLSKYYAGFHQLASDLLNPSYEDEGIPFVVHETLMGIADDLFFFDPEGYCPLTQQQCHDLCDRFRDAWGAEIGGAGTLIHTITSAMIGNEDGEGN